MPSRGQKKKRQSYEGAGVAEMMEGVRGDGGGEGGSVVVVVGVGEKRRSQGGHGIENFPPDSPRGEQMDLLQGPRDKVDLSFACSPL